MIWDSQLWNNTQAIVTQSILAGTTDVTIADSSMDFPVAVKLDSTPIPPSNFGTAFTLDPNSFTGTGNTTSFVILPETNAGNIQIKLLNGSKDAATLSILCKTKCRVVNNGVSYYRSLEQDADTTVLIAADQALLALVEADMLEYKQSYQKAQAKQAEALTLLSLARNVERAQSASRFQISAEYGGEWSRDDFETGTSPLTFS